MLDAHETALVKLNTARLALAHAVSLPDVKKIRDQASAVEHYMRRQQYSLEAIGDASELKLRAERKLGEILAEPGDRRGAALKSHGGTSTPLPDDVTRQQSQRWRMVASVPTTAFEEHIATVREQGDRVTTAGIVKIAVRKARVEKLVEISKGNAALGTATTSSGRTPTSASASRSTKPLSWRFSGHGCCRRTYISCCLGRDDGVL